MALLTIRFRVIFLARKEKKKGPLLYDAQWTL